MSASITAALLAKLGSATQSRVARGDSPFPTISSLLPPGPLSAFGGGRPDSVGNPDLGALAGDDGDLAEGNADFGAAGGEQGHGQLPGVGARSDRAEEDPSACPLLWANSLARRALDGVARLETDD